MSETTPKRGNRRDALWLGTRITLGALLLWLLLRHVQITELAVLWSGTALTSAVIAFLILLLNQWVCALRWKTLLGDDQLTSGFLVRLYMVALFFGLFLPTSIGGDAVRMVATAQETHRPGEAVASVLLDRTVGLGAMGISLLAGVLLLPDAIPALASRIRWTLPGSAVLAAVVVAGSCAVLLYVLRRRLSRLLAPAAKGIRLALRLFHDARALLRLAVLTFTAQALYTIVWLVLARGLGLHVAPLYFLLAVPVVSIAAMLPITFSGIGVREGTWVVLLGPLGVASGRAVGLGLLYLAVFAAVAATGGLVFVLWGTASKKSVGASARSSVRPPAASDPAIAAPRWKRAR